VMVPLALLVGTAMAMFVYVPGLRDKLTVKVAAMFGLKSTTAPQVSIQEYQIALDEKENSATISGIVKNISDEPVGPLQVELLLTKREDARITDTKLIQVEPAKLAPNEEGKYELKISAKDYQQSKVSRVLGKEAALRVKKLKDLIQKPQIDPSQMPAQASTE